MPDHAKFLTELQAQPLKISAADIDEPIRSCEMLSQFALLLLRVSMYVYIECSISGGPTPGQRVVRPGAEGARAAREPILPRVERRAQKAPTPVQSMQRAEDIDGKMPRLQVLLRSVHHGHGTVRAAFLCLCLVAKWFMTTGHACTVCGSATETKAERVQWPNVPPNWHNVWADREDRPAPSVGRDIKMRRAGKVLRQTCAASSKRSRPHRARDCGQQSRAKGQRGRRRWRGSGCD